MTIEKIYNYLKLSDRIGTSGYPNDDEFIYIKENRYELVINLVSHAALHQEEERILKNLGLSYIHIPVVWENPEVNDFKLFVEAMEKHSEKRLFIHCEANMRVSAFMMLFRVIYKKMPLERAMEDLHMIWKPHDQWEVFIDTVLSVLKGENIE